MHKNEIFTMESESFNKLSFLDSLVDKPQPSFEFSVSENLPIVDLVSFFFLDFFFS